MQIIYLNKKELSNTAFGTVQVKTLRAEVALGQVHRAFSGRPNWICLTSGGHRMIYTLQAGTVFFRVIYSKSHLYYSKSHFGSF